MQAYSSAFFGQGSGPIQLDNVNCIGTEATLLNCTHITSHNCGHQEDAGVACPSKIDLVLYTAIIIVMCLIGQHHTSVLDIISILTP